MGQPVQLETRLASKELRHPSTQDISRSTISWKRRVNSFNMNDAVVTDFVRKRLKVGAVWLASLLRIREGPGSNLGPETGYPGGDFYWFSSVSPGKC
jgi:hypothetical protein